MELMRIWREFWRALKGVRPPFPAAGVRFNLAVTEEALYLAGRLKKESPGFNAAVLAETARLLDLDAAAATSIRKAA